jgi:hypothetical protein
LRKRQLRPGDSSDSFHVTSLIRVAAADRSIDRPRRTDYWTEVKDRLPCKGWESGLLLGLSADDGIARCFGFF